MELTLTSGKLPDDALAFSNKIYVSREDHKTLREAAERKQAALETNTAGGDDGKKKSSSNDQVCLVQVNDQPWVFSVAHHSRVKAGMVTFSGPARRLAQIALNRPTQLHVFDPMSDRHNLLPVMKDAVFMNKCEISADFLAKKSGNSGEVKAEDLYTEVVERHLLGQFLSVGQTFVGDVFGLRVELRVQRCANVSVKMLTDDPENIEPAEARGGVVSAQTAVAFSAAEGSALSVLGASGGGSGGGGTNVLDANWNFESMGIGGLQTQFNAIFRRAFASRVFPPAMIAKLGIHHVKGILLYGPPGTGKTLMARQIGQMLNGKEPKVVNGPEILNKYVGQSEENIRELFKEAEEEYALKGENSSLHIIIFDEIDAICKQRGSRSDSTGVHDSVVNQLLSKIDGVNALNNILVIGMTNRKDLLDDALIRAGRLEVHVEISLPDTDGRYQILNIHTAKMRENDSFGNDVDLRDLAKRTKNFSGAEIEALVKAATAHALYKAIDTTDGVKVKEDESITVDHDAFEHALLEVKPAFGVSEEEFETAMRNGIIRFSPAVDALLQTGDVFVKQVATSSRTPLITMLLEGPPGAGKSAIAAKLATSSGYPFVKLISPELLVTHGEMGKADKITKTFLDAYKSPLSCIVIDDIERLLDYVRVGPRFSNVVLQTLLVLLRRDPPAGHRLLVIATTANAHVLRDLEFAECFNARLQVPFVTSGEECRVVLRDLGVFDHVSGGKSEAGDSKLLDQACSAFQKAVDDVKYTKGVPVKRLIMAAEMCMHGDEPFAIARFEHAMHAITSTFGARVGAGDDDDFGELI